MNTATICPKAKNGVVFHVLLGLFYLLDSCIAFSQAYPPTSRQIEKEIDPAMKERLQLILV